MSRLLVVRPTKRLTIEQVLRHPWLEETCDTGNKGVTSEQRETADISAAIQRLREYQARRRLKASQRVVQAVVRLVKKESSSNLLVRKLSSNRLTKDIHNSGNGGNFEEKTTAGYTWVSETANNGNNVSRGRGGGNQNHYDTTNRREQKY